MNNVTTFNSVKSRTLYALREHRPLIKGFSSSSIFSLVKSPSVHDSLACHFSSAWGIVGVCYSDELMDCLMQKSQDIQLSFTSVCLKRAQKIIDNVLRYSSLNEKVVALYAESILLMLKELIPCIRAITDNNGYHTHYQTPFLYASQKKRYQAQERAGVILAAAYSILQPSLCTNTFSYLKNEMWEILYSSYFQRSVKTYVKTYLCVYSHRLLSSSYLSMKETYIAVDFILESRLQRINEYGSLATPPETTRLGNGVC